MFARRSANIAPRPGFRAFLSYSHADAETAAKLHHRLETYRLPSRLRDAEEGGAGRLMPIFRDREDLPAADDLSESVKAALDVSDTLVVLCSPEAAASQWVNREIELYRKLHPDRPVLAALVRGEPEDAFPPALTRDREPLAADLRPETGDGKLGFLKVVAGIARLPLDTLIQRDAQRRLRRVIGITVASVAGMIIAGAMTVVAIQSRNEAQRQRAEAEDLVEFMLTDLRANLKSVGRLDVMAGVNRRAMEHYERQGNLAELPPDSLARRAKILHLMSDDELQQGRIERARNSAAEAYRYTQALLEHEPDDPEWIYVHAQSEFWIGRIAYAEVNWPQVAEHWGAYHHLAQRLLEIEPGNVTWLTEAAYAMGNLCTLALQRDDRTEDPLPYCEQSYTTMRRALAGDPHDYELRKATATRLGWLAIAEADAGMVDKALASNRDRLAMFQAIYDADRQNVDALDALMRAKLTFAEFLYANDMIAEGAPMRRDAIRMAETMVRTDPANKLWAGWLDRLRKLAPRQQREGEK